MKIHNGKGMLIRMRKEVRKGKGIEKTAGNGDGDEARKKRS